MRRSVDVRKVGLYIALTYLITFFGMFIYVRKGGAWTLPAAMVYMFVPAFVAILVQRGIYKQPWLGPFRLSLRLNRWFLIAGLIPVLLLFAVVAMSTLVPGVSLSAGANDILERQVRLCPEHEQLLRQQFAAAPLHPFWMGLLSGVIAGFTINAIVLLGEEIGWRGLMLTELEPLGFWRVSAITGLVWGFWHLPAILQGHNYPGTPLAGVFMMTLLALVMSPLHTYVTLRARSVAAASILHGTINGIAGLPPMVLVGGTALTTGFTGWAGIITLGLANIALWAFGRITELDNEVMARGS